MQAPAAALVIGGGIIGLTTSLALQRRGLSVTLVDPAEEPPPASWGNAGHIAIEQTAPLASLATLSQAPRRLVSRDGALALPLSEAGAWAPFGLKLIAAAHPARFQAGQAALAALLAQALPAWRRLMTNLGRPQLLREKGHFLVWEKHLSAKAAIARLLRQPAPNVRYRPLTAAEKRKICALIKREPSGALYCEGSAQVTHLLNLRTAIQQALVSAGGVIRRGRIAELTASIDGVMARLDKEEGAISAELALITAGVGSGRLLSRFGRAPPLIAERGYHLHARTHNWPSDIPSITFEDRSLFVTPFANGLRGSSFLELSRPERAPDPRKWQLLRTHFRELNLPIEGDLEQWMGSRPTLPDYLPAIGQISAAPRVFYAFGHQHLGLTLAAITAEAISALAAGQAPPLSLAPFDIRRFG